ncbi:hypothetical protein [Azospirillum agricola]|uniref:hypothetical protein n=1 Tax=Azospirillum agricola TaxID=1720247 RepID=UPI000A0F139C|nr:hypothetical protein [Azospirillum agricola]SMH36119.1 hypothetical protein SAMN02982994_0994 [Azospirillum lipoferum]
MADADSSTASPNEQDLELIRLGEAYMVLLRDTHGPSWGLHGATDDQIHRICTMEDRIAETPARTAGGLAVRLFALWSIECERDESLFAGPPEGASITRRLAWGALKDAERLAARG